MSIERISELRKYILDLGREMTTYIDSGPEIAELSNALLQFNLAKRDLSVIYDEMSFAVAGVMGSEELVSLDNGAVIEKKGSYDRKAWQHKALATSVVSKLMRMSIDKETGEILNTPEEIALQLLDYAHCDYWRTKELDKIGINADSYCETGQLKISIIVRKGNNE